MTNSHPHVNYVARCVQGPCTLMYFRGMARENVDIVHAIETGTLQNLLDQLETLSRYGSPKETTFAKKKSIVDHVKFLIAKALHEKDG